MIRANGSPAKSQYPTHLHDEKGTDMNVAAPAPPQEAEVQPHPLVKFDDSFDRYPDDEEFDQRHGSAEFGWIGESPDGAAVDILQVEKRRVAEPHATHFEQPVVAVYSGRDRVVLPLKIAAAVGEAIIDRALRIVLCDEPEQSAAVTRVTEDQPKRPLAVWQKTPCPAWCDETHRDWEQPDDRWHIRGVGGVDRSMQRAQESAPGQFRLPTVDVLVQQIEGMASAFVMVHDNSEKDAEIKLTLDEAALLIETLGDALDIARGIARGNSVPTRTAVPS